MSPQTNPFPHGTPPPGNVFFLFCGLSISHLNSKRATAIWESAILENTGAPQHAGDMGFRISVTVRSSSGHIVEQFPIDLPEFNLARNRFLTFDAEKNATPGGLYNKARAGQYSSTHVGDFAQFEQPPDRGVLFKRSNTVKISKVRINGGLGFTGILSQAVSGKPQGYKFNKSSTRWLAKCFGVALNCDPGSVINGYINNHGRRASGKKFRVPPKGHTITFLLHNDCEHEGLQNDFPYYYNDLRAQPKNYGIVVPRFKAKLTLVSMNKNGRVACNAMLASELDGHTSLWEAVEQK